MKYSINYKTANGSFLSQNIEIGNNLNRAVKEAKQLAYSVTFLGSVTHWKVFSNEKIVIEGVVGYTREGKRMKFSK